MADQLATQADLEAILQRTVAAPTATLLLELATSVVQGAAGQRIVNVTDTAVIDVTEPGRWLDLPQYPIRTVVSVTLDGTAITDWSIRQQRLYRSIGWMQRLDPPSQAVVQYAHGLVAGSQYLQLGRNMTLSLAAAGYGNPTLVESEAIDDYRVTYAEALSRMELTEFMRAAIVNAYGRSAYVTSSTCD